MMNKPSRLKWGPLRKTSLAAALLLLVGGTAAPAFGAGPPAQSAAAPQILVSGVAPGSPAVQKIVDAAYERALAADHASALDAAQWQPVLASIDAELQKAGFANAHAFLANEVAVFAVKPTGQLAVTTPKPVTRKVPPVVARDTAAGASERVAVRGFAVAGVGQHPRQDITPASIEQLANAQLAKLGGGGRQAVELDFDQLQQVADAITTRYRKAGFIVATAYVPVQTIAADGVVRLDVLEGRIGKVEVQGTRHYRPWVIAAPAEKLRGRPLQQDDIDTALLYDRDLPAVSVSSTFQPGAKPGDTDLIMVAHEGHPLSVTLGTNNYGTDVTGRYHAVASLAWNDPLGLGDRLAATIDYAFDPHQNTYGSLGYTLPTVKVPGLSLLVGADRSELQLSSGPFAALGVHGPTSRYFGGAEWKFVNRTDLSMTGSAQFIHEQSVLNSKGLPLSDERFGVAQLAFALQHTDKRFHGIDMLSVAVRHSLSNDSLEPDLVSLNHARSFTITKFGYTRIQFLSPNQQLFFKLAGQYTGDALVPMEQFVIGGPDSVRAYPVAENLSDRGFYGSFAYHVNAPGFANKPSPFHGQPWGQLLTFEAFVDHARGYPAGADRGTDVPALTYSGVGAGVIFRLPRWHDLLFHLDAATPFGSQSSQVPGDYQIYGRLDLTF